MQDALINITAEDMELLAKQAQASNGKDAPLPKGLNKVEVAASMRAGMLAFIVAWNLTDEQDQPLPITAESINALEPEDGRFLQAEVKKRIAARRSEESRRPFGKPSSSPSAPSRARASKPHGS